MHEHNYVVYVRHKIYVVKLNHLFSKQKKNRMHAKDWDIELKKKKNFMAPFYGWGSTASRLEPLRGGSLLFITKFPEISGTHFTDLGRMKG